MAAREVLATERLRTLALCQALHNDFDSIVEASTPSNADDEHDPEGATVAFERAQVVALLAQSRSDWTTSTGLSSGASGAATGSARAVARPIPAEPLAARPATRICLRCAV